jgi:choline transport protein
MSDIEKKDPAIASVSTEKAEVGNNYIEGTLDGVVVNASGHQDEFQRHFSIWSLCGLALTIDNAWVALGGSLYLAVCTSTPYPFGLADRDRQWWRARHPVRAARGLFLLRLHRGQHAGRVLGFFAGSINFFGWMFDLASIAQIEASVGVQMYAVFHPDLVIEPWQVYITYVMLTVVCVTFCIFYNRWIPKLQDAGLFLIVGGGLITIIVVRVEGLGERDGLGRRGRLPDGRSQRRLHDWHARQHHAHRRGASGPEA